MYQYFAFISFQSADAKAAVKLQHAIENYRLPAVLCKESNVPRRIKPLYCYLNDMHAGEELMQELKARMEQSRYLIVVCSPHSARSVYVNSGIDYFVSLGRRDSIIPVIVDGVPYSGYEATERFPEALRRHFPKHSDPLQDHSILGINVREAGLSRRKAYDRAMLMVVARMLQLDFNGLLLRDKQRRRRRTVAWSLLALFVAVALTLVWLLAQTVTVALKVEEAAPQNEALPPCREIAVAMYLDDEVKRDTLHSMDETLSLSNIPPKYIGREVRLTLSAPDYCPCDTLLRLQREQTLSLRRDAEVYGHVHFRIVGLSRPDKAVIRVGECTMQANPEGVVDALIPIASQRTQYTVRINDYTDILYMPCGEDAVIVPEP